MYSRPRKRDHLYSSANLSSISLEEALREPWSTMRIAGSVVLMELSALA